MTEKTNYVGTETELTHPENWNKLMENSRTYFDNDSWFTIWKTIAGYTLEEDNVRDLLDWKTIGPFELTKKDGSGTFNASLKLENVNEWKISFVFENSTWGGWSKESKFKCPISGNPLMESAKAYSNRESGFTIWKVMSQHELTEDEVETLLSTWEVGPISDFVSTKTWKSFEATIILDESNNKKPIFKFD